MSVFNWLSMPLLIDALQYKRTEVVDADLSDYFSSIPHGQLMKCISRRIVDKQLLAAIKQWLEMPVIERVDERVDSGNRCTTEAKDKHRGTPQGSPCSPLFSNIYFWRFILAWHRFGYAEDLDARVVNYADDFVICTKPGNGEQVMKNMHTVMSRIGLEVNEDKTRLASLPEDSFDFLGYNIGRSYTCRGKPFIGSKPSKKSVQRIMGKIHEETSVRWISTTAEKRVTELNQIVRGWVNYFNQGPVLKEYKRIQRYMNRRLQLWLARKHKLKGKGYRQYPEQYFYEKLGLIKLPTTRAELSRAKA